MKHNPSQRTQALAELRQARDDVNQLLHPTRYESPGSFQALLQRALNLLDHRIEMEENRTPQRVRYALSMDTLKEAEKQLQAEVDAAETEHDRRDAQRFLDVTRNRIHQQEHDAQQLKEWHQR